MKANPLFKLIFRSIVLLIAIASTLIGFILPNLTPGGDPISPFLFFTNWSVYLATLSAALVFALNLVGFIRKEEKASLAVDLIQFSAVMMILVTFIVSAFVLPDKIWMAGYWKPASIFKHFLFPILIFVDYFAFARKGSAKAYSPFVALIAPLLYWVILISRIMIARNEHGGALPEALWPYYYPYGFTNLDNGKSLGFLLGLGGGIMAAMIAIGFLFYFLKRAKKAE